MAVPRAFISFEMEDVTARNFLVQQAKDSDNDISFVDYSVQNPFDSAWKTNCKQRIAQTMGTIVIIGATTFSSEACLWEIAETQRQNHYLFAVRRFSDKNHRIPLGLTPAQVIPWRFDEIVRRLTKWV